MRQTDIISKPVFVVTTANQINQAYSFLVQQDKKAQQRVLQSTTKCLLEGYEKIDIIKKQGGKAWSDFMDDCTVYAIAQYCMFKKPLPITDSKALEKEGMKYKIKKCTHH